MYFSRLSSAAYPGKADSIRKAPAPAFSTDKKQQKTYSEIVADRNDFIADDFKEDRIVDDTLLLNRVNGILARLRNANKNLPFDSVRFFIKRSSGPNAYSTGDGNLFIQLGLLFWFDTDDEIAMVMGHEMSHYFLHHYEARLRKNIEIVSSDEFKDEIKAIKKSKEHKFTKFRDLLKDFVVKTGSHSRYKESEADSMGLEIIKRAGYDVKRAPEFLLKLDNSDELYTEAGLYPVKENLLKANMPAYLFAPAKKYNGLSTVKVEMNADLAFDTIKTHPDCKSRYKTLTGKEAEFVSVNCCTKMSPDMSPVKQRAMIELVRYAFERQNLTLCTHLCLFAMQNGYTDNYFPAMLSASFSGMVYADKHFQKFSATNAGAVPGSTLKELQDIIFRADNDALAKAAAFYLSSCGNGEDNAFAKYIYEIGPEGKDADAATTAFQKAYPDSKYNYLFTKNSNKK